MQQLQNTIAPTVGTISANNGSGTRSFTHVQDVGADLLVVTVNEWTGAGATEVTGVTYNGVAATRQVLADSSDAKAQIWTLHKPAYGSNTLVVTSTGGGATYVTAYSIFNANNVDAVRAVASTIGAQAAFAVQVNSAVGDLVIEGSVFVFGTGTPIPGQVEATFTDNNPVYRYSSYRPNVLGPSVVGWNKTTNERTACAVIAIKAA